MVGAEEAVTNWTLMYQFVPLTFSTNDKPDDFNFRVAAPYIGVFYTVTLDVPAGITNITVPISSDQGCLQSYTFSRVNHLPNAHKPRFTNARTHTHRCL